VCPIIGGSAGVEIDKCGTCDQCLASKCCTQSTTCFTEVDGGDSCFDLFDCYDKCETADGGDPSGTCKNACATAYPADVKAAADNMNACAATNCKTECGL
jgi:hypothetical protein